jgi:hypothetical protein
VIPAHKETQARRVTQAPRVFRDPQAIQEQTARPETQGQPVSRENPVQKDQRGQRVPPPRFQVRKENREIPAHRESQDHKEIQGRTPQFPGLRVIPGSRAFRGFPVQRDSSSCLSGATTF